MSDILKVLAAHSGSDSLEHDKLISELKDLVGKNSEYARLLIAVEKHANATAIAHHALVVMAEEIERGEIK